MKTTVTIWYVTLCTCLYVHSKNHSRFTGGNHFPYTCGMLYSYCITCTCTLCLCLFCMLYRLFDIYTILKIVRVMYISSLNVSLLTSQNCCWLVIHCVLLRIMAMFCSSFACTGLNSLFRYCHWYNIRIHLRIYIYHLPILCVHGIQ
jgi:hypothetical protein